MKTLSLIFIVIFGHTVLANTEDVEQKSGFLVGHQVLCDRERGQIKSLRANGMIEVQFQVKFDNEGYFMPARQTSGNEQQTTYTPSLRFVYVDKCEHLQETKSEETVDGFGRSAQVLCDGNMIGNLTHIYRYQKTAMVYITHKFSGGVMTEEVVKRARYLPLSSCEDITIDNVKSNLHGTYQVSDQVLCDKKIGVIRSLRRNGMMDFFFSQELTDDGQIKTVSSHTITQKPPKDCIKFNPVPEIPYDFEPGGGRSLSRLDIFDDARLVNPFRGMFLDKATPRDISLLTQ